MKQDMNNNRENNLWDLIRPSLQNHHACFAWICREKQMKRTVRYQQIHDAVLTNAHRLRQHGIVDGDTVSITAPNGPEWSVAAFACWKIGATVAPIHIGNSDTDILNQLTALSPRIMLFKNTVCQHRNAMEITMQPSPDAVKEEQQIPTGENNVAARIYTSGSTGNAKIVRLSHNNFSSNMLAICKIQGFTPSDRFISLLPFSHAMGLTANLLLPFYCGCTVVTPKVLAASEILATLNEEKISVLIGVPRLFRNIMNGLEKKFENSGALLNVYIGLLRCSPLYIRKRLNILLRKKLGGQIKTWVSGGSHLDAEISRYFHGLGLPLRQGYGLTETAPLVCIQEAFDPAVHSVGKPIQEVQVRISNPGEKDHGEICIKGPNVMLGYENPQHNDAAFDGQWFKTGDIGVVDEQGRVTLTGRSKRLIVTETGKNVYPEKIEILLERYPGIKEAGVFELNMKPVCVLSTDFEDDGVTAKQVLKNYNKMASPHNQISRFAVVNELPRTSLGKLALQQLPEVFALHEIKGL